MATLKLNKFILLPGRALAALVRCGFPVSAGIVMKTFSPDTGRIFYENEVSDYLLHKFSEIVRWYEDCPCPTGRLRQARRYGCSFPARNPKRTMPS